MWGVWWFQVLDLAGIWQRYGYQAVQWEGMRGSGGWYAQAPEGWLLKVGPTLKPETLGRSGPLHRWLPNPAGRGWVFWEELQRGFRHSSAGRLVWQEGPQTHRLPGQRWREAAFTPDGTTLLAADDHNLYAYTLSKGAWDTLTRYTAPKQAGTTDWLYEEEFSFTQAFAISPSGTYVAFLLLDGTSLPTYPLLFYGAGYPALQKISYPRVGEPNPKVALGLLHLPTRTIEYLWQDTTGGYIPWFSWSPMGDELYFTHLVRTQNRFTLYKYTPEEGVAPFFSDSTEGYFTWDDRQLVVFAEDRPELIYRAAGRPTVELWRLDYKGRRLGTYNVPGLRSLIGFVGDKVFFHAAGQTPKDQRVGYLYLPKRRVEWLTPAEGWAEGELMGEVLHLRYSTFLTPPQEELRAARQPMQRFPLPDLNADLRRQRLPIQVRFMEFATSAGKRRWAYLAGPERWDSTRPHPILLTFYGGPGSQQVKEAFNGTFLAWYAYLAQKGFLVACMDGIGTALYPAERFATYRRLGEAEAQELAEFVRWLRSQPYSGPVVAFGWSYGGYLAIRLAFLAPEGLRAAIAVAPVTDWRLYDTAYTERFMDLLSANSEGYLRTALPPSDKPLRVPLLLIHGEADDNVHVQHTYRFLERLWRAQPDAPVEWRIFPNQNHGLGGYRYRVFLEVERFMERVGTRP
ncbi:MAG: prolyl oligopeptidase family serine peptidase [Bacteroidia bacterium]|nr:prolyl oligopeptidase family serine peptidase [Bacteroidia bacterium]MDW8089070.1 prolyl oligopeptidase family serine peptidase [Bacteroidia bacterium]